MFPVAQPAAVTHDQVTAIIAAIGADAGILPDTVHAVANQSVLPQRIILAVPSAAAAAPIQKDPLIQERLRGRLIVAPVGKVETFGENIKLALKRVRDGEQRRAANDASWLWLLHADSVPAPEALERLLDKAETSAKIGIVGPKQIAPQKAAPEPPAAPEQLDPEQLDPEHLDSEQPAPEHAVPGQKPRGPVTLREVGIRATRTARRVPDIREGERDQGQYDNREDMLAVGSAGMLVRETAWDHLGGFNPNLGPFGDGLEFSRRMWLAGYRVVVAPQAVVAHGNTSLAPDGHLSRSYGARRRAQIFNALLAAPAPAVWIMWLAYILGAFPRAIVRLVWRDGERARGEIAAGLSMLGMMGAVAKGRRAIAVLRGDHAVLRQLESSRKDVRQGKKNVRRAQEDEAQQQVIDPLEEKAKRDLQRHTRKGALLTALLAGVYSVLLHVPYMSAGVLAGGTLATDSATAADLSRAALHSWMASGGGYSGTLDPYWLVFLPFLYLGLPWGFTLGQAVTASLYIAPLVAALAAYLAAGVFTKSWIVRSLAAGIWIVSPSLLEALAQGRSASVTVHILLPLAVFAVVKAWRKAQGSLASHCPAGVYIGVASLVFAALTLAAPLYALAALLVALIGVIGCARARKRWLWVPVPALAFLIQPAIHLRASWRAWLSYFFSSPGAPASTSADPRSVLMGFAGRSFDLSHPSLDWALFISVAIMIGAAALALLRLRAAAAVRIAWLLIACGLALAILGRYVPVAVLPVDGVLTPAPAWHGRAYSLAWLGVFIAIAAAANGLRSSLRRISFGPLTFIAAVCAFALPLSVVTIASVWVAEEWTSEEHTLHADYPQDSESHVPAIGAAGQASPERSRVLALSAAGHSYEAQIWRADGLHMHEYSSARLAQQAAEIFPLSREGISPQTEKAAQFDAAETDLGQAIANIPASGEAVARILADHAISVVLVPPASDNTDTQAQAQLRAWLNAVPGLEYVTENATGAFWRVQQSQVPARLRLIAGDSTSDSSALSSDALSRSGAQAVPSGIYTASADIESASTNRYLVLAERADRGWLATIDGHRLERLTPEEAASKGLPQWANIWEVPSSMAGHLRVYYQEWLHLGICAVQAILLLIGAVTALPLRSRREDVA